MWRKFQFFERSQEDVSNETFASNISCAAAGHGRIIFGTTDGLVHVVERGFSLRGTFRAYGSCVSHICQLKHSNLLVTLGENDASPTTALSSTTLKLWDIAKCLTSSTSSGTEGGATAAGAAGSAATNARGGASVAACIRAVKLFAGKNFPESPVTSFLVTEDNFPGHLLVAAGLASGHVYLLRGDVARDKAGRSRLEVLSHGGSNAGVGTQYKVAPSVFSDSIHAGGSSHGVGGADASSHEPSLGVGGGHGVGVAVPASATAGAGGSRDVGGVTGVGVRLEPRAAFLFATTVATTVVFNLGNLQMDKVVLDDSCGALPGRTVMSHAQELVVGRPEAFFFYDCDGRGPCFVFDGQKQKVAWFRGYLLAVVGEEATKSTFNIYDLKNKLIAFSAHLGDVRHVMSEWGAVIVFTADHKVHTLTEKDLPSKLQMLFRKSLYSIAINLAQGSHEGAGGSGHNTADFSITADVLRMYGDHLYLKQDFDGAMAQYLQTIGWLEPSYVIRRYLDAQRISLLATYLDALHARGVATADHTTLLLNCYTKLKDVKKLDEFIRAEDEGAAGSAYNFDVSTAVRVCRAAGYFSHALAMSRRAGLHREHLHILLDDVGRFDDAVDYLHTLPLAEAERAMRSYGKTLVKHRPHAATMLLMRICDPQSVDPPTAVTPASTSAAAPAQSNAAASASVSGAPGSRLPDARPSFATPGAPPVLGRRRPVDIDARVAAVVASLPPPAVTEEDDPFGADPWAMPIVSAGGAPARPYGIGGGVGIAPMGGGAVDTGGFMGRGGAGPMMMGGAVDVDELSRRGMMGTDGGGRETTGLPMAVPPPRAARRVPSHAEFLGLFVDRPRALLLFLEQALPAVKADSNKHLFHLQLEREQLAPSQGESTFRTSAWHPFLGWAHVSGPSATSRHIPLACHNYLLPFLIFTSDLPHACGVSVPPPLSCPLPWAHGWSGHRCVPPSLVHSAPRSGHVSWSLFAPPSPPQGTPGERSLTNTLLELYLMRSLVDGGAAERPLPLASGIAPPSSPPSLSPVTADDAGSLPPGTRQVADGRDGAVRAADGDVGGRGSQQATGTGAGGGRGGVDGSSSGMTVSSGVEGSAGGGPSGQVGAPLSALAEGGKAVEGAAAEHGSVARDVDGRVADVDFAERRAKGMNLLLSGWPSQLEPVYDADLALMLCQVHSCRDGRLFLLERLRLFRDVLACYMEENDSQGLIQACKRLADPSRGGQPNLWVDVLTYFSNQDRDCSPEVSEALRHVERDDLLPPLLVLHTLARNKRLSLAVVKDYVTRHIQRESALVEADAADIRKYKEETAAMKKEVAEIQTQPRIFQLSKCTACSAMLDLPAVHFLCMHSYHQRCLNDSERECPTCAPAARTVMEIKRNLDQSVGDHDTFFKHLQSADDGFSVVADYFGRGVINRARGTGAAASVAANHPATHAAPTMQHGADTW